MLPLPGSAAICAASKSLAVDANGNPLTTDQRGFPLGASSYCPASSVDAGAVQTNYTAVAFTNIPSGGVYAAVQNQIPNPAPNVSVTENGQNIGGVPDPAGQQRHQHRLTLANGTSSVGGGISNSGTLTVNACVVSGNTATDVGGGINNNGTLTVTNSTFSSNTTAFAGGGINNFETRVVSGSTFLGNTASSNGGLLTMQVLWALKRRPR
jgi:hypothetical protein